MDQQALPLPPFGEDSHRFVEVNGTRLHYLDTGGTGKPVLLLHGINQNVRTWEMVLPSLQGPWRLLAVDQRGHGLSEADGVMIYHRGQMVADCRALIEALGLTQPVIVGHSLGGYVGLRVAATYPELVGGLVVADMTPDPIYEMMPARIAAMRKALKPGLGDAAWASEDEAAAFRRQLFPGEDEGVIRARLRQQLRRRPDGRLELARSAAVARAMLEELLTTSVWPFLADIQCPTLLVRAELSDVLTEENAQRMAQRVPHCQLVTIKGAAHDLQLYQPEQFGAAIARFLREVAA